MSIERERFREFYDLVCRGQLDKEQLTALAAAVANTLGTSDVSGRTGSRRKRKARRSSAVIFACLRRRFGHEVYTSGRVCGLCSAGSRRLILNIGAVKGGEAYERAALGPPRSERQQASAMTPAVAKPNRRKRRKGKKR